MTAQSYTMPNGAPKDPRDDRCLEAVTISVGFDDFLDETLRINHPHFDTMIVVTSHDDTKTHGVARKHGAVLVQTDLHKKNGRPFNKGAAINAGFGRFMYHGWRMHLDADIALPDNFRRILFNMSHLEKSCIYGADRVDVVGREDLQKTNSQQHQHSMLLVPPTDRAIGARYIDHLRGYCPLGFFQLWHADSQHAYPYSLGTAEHDDIMFSACWPESQRRHLPGVICHHLCSKTPRWGENWGGERKQPRLA